MEIPYLQLIGGEWVPAQGGGTWDVINPATEAIVRTVPFGNADDCDRAIAAAVRALTDWSRQTPYHRAGILLHAAALVRARAGDLARVTVEESGKVLAEARGEWMVAADLLEWFAEEGKRAYGRTIPSRRDGKRLLVLRQPIGVVGVITAWNFPAYNPARAWAAALAAGCTVVARPSEFTPLSAMQLAGILQEAGLPAGALNLVNGDPHAIGQVMLDRPELRKISFTGSVRVGKLLMDGASRTLTRLGLELGGNAPVLVFSDVDVEAVARAAVAARYRNAGQVCVAPQRFLVHAKIHDHFAETLVSQVKGLRVGPGLEPTSQVGPMINAKQRDRVEALVDGARSSGLAVLAGGARPAQQPKGYFYQPTVVTGVKPGMPICDQEIFGPVLPMLSFEDVDEAIEIANATPYGLAAYVWTNHLPVALRVAERLDFGMVGLNDWAPQATEAPFAGHKESGLGHECGQEGLGDYLETKLVSLAGL